MACERPCSPHSPCCPLLQLLTEALFLEAALQLVSADCSKLTINQAKELEHLTFDWIINGEKYIDFRFPELHKVRDRVVLAAAKLLGSLSPLQLDSITERFLREMAIRLRADANSPQRQELYNLCTGLRYLQLHGSSAPQASH
jgi:hypothetical protein